MFPALIAFLIGILSLFADINTRKGKWYAGFLGVLLALACVFQIKESFDDKVDSDRQESQITDLATALKNFSTQTQKSLDDIDDKLDTIRSFGFTRPNPSLETIEQSLEANQLRTLISTSTDPDSRQKITVQYFPKDVDRQIVERSLRELGFELTSGQPNLKNVPTNAIWFGSEVPIDDVKLVAYTLIRAGVDIKIIRPFRNPGGSKARLIQVGSDAQYQSSSPLSVNEIQQAENFTR